jgi:predicted ATP-grasp superfamily ATP-dependent carboligase
MYTGALENHPELVDQMAWVAPLWGNPGDVLARVRSPWELASALNDAGLLFPEARSSSEELPMDGSWLVKTYRGASGSGVRAFAETRRQGDRETGRETAFDAVPESRCLPLSLSPFLCYQRRVAGTSCAAAYVASREGATLLGITRQLVGEAWLGAHGFQYAGSIGPWRVSDTALDTIVRIGNVIAENFELSGLFGVDLVIDGSDVWTIEVNPRYTASVEIVERAMGISAIAAHASACAEGHGAGNSGLGTSAPHQVMPTARGPQLPVHGKAILFAKQEVVISKQLAESALTKALRKPWPALADIPGAGTPIEAGRPILTLFAEGATVDEVEHRLRKHAMQIEQALN